MQNPVDINSLRDYAEWKDKCDVKGQAFCSLPNPCPLTTRYGGSFDISTSSSFYK